MGGGGGGVSSFSIFLVCGRAIIYTFLPTITTLPSPAHATVKPSPPKLTTATHCLFRTSQNRQVPSPETLANSASFVGLNATRSIAAVWPFSSVEFFTCGFSGFQMRRVRSALPVAISVPEGFQAMVRIVWEPGLRVDGSW